MHSFRKILRLLLFSLFCFFCTASKAQELWTAGRLNLHLTNKLELQPDFQVRFRHDPSLQSYAHLYKLNIKYRFNNRWKVGGSFRITENQETENQEADEISKTEIPDRKRYTFDIYYKFPINNSKTTIENRLRYQISQTKKLNYKNYLRYRFGLEYPLIKSIYVSASDEIYLEYPDLKLCLNKTSLEIEFGIIKGFKQKLFYTIETNLQSKSSIFNYIIGCKLEINPKQLFN